MFSLCTSIVLHYLCPIMRKILIITIMIITCVNSFAQTMMQSQYGTSASGMSSDRFDRNGNPIDTTAVVDASTVPVGLSSWTIDERFGNRIQVPVDTLQFGFQNSNDNGGPTGHFTHLGNLGSPRISHVFFERKESTQEFFTDPYSFSYDTPGTVKYTNTKSPFTNLTYYKLGSSRRAEEQFKAYFAVNVNKRLGFGFDIDYIYGRGQFQNQSTAQFNGNLFTYYHGDKYEMHFNFINNNYKVTENGGISDDRYITHPLEMADGKRVYKSYEIQTNLQDIWNKNTGYHAFLSHRYNLGFYKDESSENDTIVKEVFVPVTSFIHTVKVDMNTRRYISQNDKQNREYFQNNYLGNDSTDMTKYMSVKNTVGISLREGFNKWAKAGLTAFVSFEHRRFSMTDSINGTPGQFMRDYKENTLSVGGQLIKSQGKTIHYDVLGEIAVLGEDIGQFNIEGKGDLNFRLFNDTVRLDANAYIKNIKPTFYYRHFHSKHYWWDNDLSMITRTKLEGKLSIDRWRTQLQAGVENITNYTYLDNTSVGYTSSNDTGTKTYKNDVAVRQNAGNIQVFSAKLRQDFKLGILHLDNEVVYQKSSNSTILPLPDLVLYHNLYIRAGLAKKVLTVELGADVRYFTQYYAPDYAPAIGQFYLQNPETRYKLGGYPLVNGYLNIHLKRTRIFVMMYNLVQGTGERSYIFAPHYPLNPRAFKFGISWNFFD